MSALKDLTSILYYSYIIIDFFGVTGNLLSLAIFSRPKFKATIFNTFFRFMCLNNLLVLFSKFEWFCEVIGILNIRNNYVFVCKLYYYTIYFSPPVTSWSLVFISFDRMISICFPARYLFRKKPKNQIKMCVLILILNIIFYSPQLFAKINIYFDTLTNITLHRCEYFNPNGLFDLIDIFYSTIITFVLMSISVSFSLRSIYKSRRNASLNSSMTKLKDIKFAITSIALNLIFVFLNSPISIFYILAFFNSIDFDDEIYKFMDTFLNILFYSNYASLFYINLIVNSLFRSEFILFLKEIRQKLGIF